MEGVDGMDKLSIEELEKILEEKKKVENENNKYVNSESGNFSKKILKRIFLGFIAFVIAILYVFFKTGSEPTALVTGVIAFLSVEVWQLARIKIAEAKEDEKVD